MKSLGRKPQGARLERVKASPRWAGTFSFAMHAWDQPAEVLLELGPKACARLVMPRLGEAIEPAHAEAVEPWWRAVDKTGKAKAETPTETTLPKAMPWPID